MGVERYSVSNGLKLLINNYRIVFWKENTENCEEPEPMPSKMSDLRIYAQSFNEFRSLLIKTFLFACKCDIPPRIKPAGVF